MATLQVMGVTVVSGKLLAADCHVDWLRSCMVRVVHDSSLGPAGAAQDYQAASARREKHFEHVALKDNPVAISDNYKLDDGWPESLISQPQM